MSTTHYRRDVDGLRAVAVVSVLLFHAFPEAFPGGFIGVDVFFVISGYLITKILLREMSAGTFTFVGFYQRRVRRIWPALMLVLSSSFVAAFLLMFREEFKSFSGYLVMGTLSAGNLRNLLSNSYFDTASDLQPFLHLWSLGVEEQYYLVWPVLLLLVLTVAPLARRAHAIMAITIAASFGLNLFVLRRSPSAAFYLPFTRLWELGLGGLLACRQVRDSNGAQTRLQLRSPAGAQALSMVGALLLAASLVLIDESKAFPGWWALLPVFGAYAVIAAGPTAWLNQHVLGSGPLVAIGLVSYPLYLWHWPLLSFARLCSPLPLGKVELVALLGLAGMLSWLTYRFVESPLRGASRETRVTAVLLAASVALALLGLGGWLRLLTPRTRSSSAFVSEETQRDTALRRNYGERPCEGRIDVAPLAKKYCSLVEGPPGAPWLVLWGDSHARAWSPAIFALGKQLGYGVVVLTRTGFPPLLHARRTDASADAAYTTFAASEDALRTISGLRPAHIFLVARWDLYSNGWWVQGKLESATPFLTQSPSEKADLASSRATLSEQLPRTLASLLTVAPLTVFKAVPWLGFPIEQGLERDPHGFEPMLRQHRQRLAFVEKLIDIAAARNPDMTVLDPALTMCDEKCRARLQDTLLYEDDNHLTAQGAQLFVPQLVKIMMRNFGQRMARSELELPAPSR